MAQKKKSVIGELVSQKDVKNIDLLQASLDNLTKTFDNMAMSISSFSEKFSEITKSFSSIKMSIDKSSLDKQISDMDKMFGTTRSGQVTLFPFADAEMKRAKLEQETNREKLKNQEEQFKQMAALTANGLLSQEQINKELIKMPEYAEKYVNYQISNLNLSRLQAVSLRLSDEYMAAYVANQIESVGLSNDQMSALTQSASYIQEITRQQILQNESSIKQTQSLSQSKEYIDSVLKKEQASLQLNKQIAKARIDALPPLEKAKRILDDVRSKLNGSSVGSNVSGEFSQIKGSIVSLFSIYKFVDYASDAKDAIGSWVENMNLFQIAFDRTAPRTYDWANSFAKKLGVARSEVTKILATFRELTETMGASSQLADSLSLSFTQMAYDLASVWDKQINEVTESLQSGIISGQIRTLRKFGIDISQDSVQTLLQTNNALKELNLSAANLSQSQKVLARTIIALESVGESVAGDMAKTISSLANRQRIFQSQLTELKTSLGAIFYEKFSTFYAYLIAIVKIVNKTLDRVFNVSDKLREIAKIGKTEEADPTKLTKEEEEQLRTGIWKDLSEEEKQYMKFLTERRLESGLATKQVVDGNVQIVDTTEEMVEAQDAYNKTLSSLPFDKWQSMTSGSASSAKTTRALMEEYAKSMAKYDQQSAKHSEARDEQVESIIKKLEGKLVPIIEKIIKWLDDAEEVIEQFLNAMIEALPSILNALTDIMRLVTKILKWFNKIGITDDIIKIVFYLNIIKSFMSPILGIGSGILGIVMKIKQMSLATKASASVLKTFASDTSKNMINVTNATNAANAAILGLSLGILRVSFSKLFSNENLSMIQKFVVAILALAAGIMVAAAAWSFGPIAAISTGAIAAALISHIGTQAANSINKYATGGTPADGELFYMNDGGKPEALFNAGGNKTSVINIDQLSEGMRRGFVMAINETGLADGGKIIIEGRNIDNSTVARGLFNSLEYESKRRGGNRL